jgi:hypothetical protein
MLLAFHQGQHLEKTGVDCFGVDLDDTSDSKLHLMRQYQTLNVARSIEIRKEMGFSILCLRSLIPGAGRGVFVDGHALAGTLVAFQPGEVWAKEFLLNNSRDLIEHFDNDENLQLSLRFDEYLIDSRNSPVTVLTREGSMNPWALGHMVNHPSPDAQPNGMSAMLNFTERMKLGPLLKYVPNSYAQEPGWQSSFFFPEPLYMHGLCLIARQDVKNEELLYDYRLQGEGIPGWYSVVNHGDTMMEDEQTVFFRDDWMEKEERAAKQKSTREYFADRRKKSS